MTDYIEKEARMIEKISKRFDELDANLVKMEDTDSKVKKYFEQEKALHDIHSIIRSENRIEKYEDKAEQKNEQDAQKLAKHENDTIDKIQNELDSLDKTLSEITDDDSKVKSYLEQKKVIHTIKELIKNVENL